MQNRYGKKDESFFKPWHLLIVVPVLIACFVYSYTAMRKAYTVDPPKTFEEYFTNKLDRIQDLQGGGSISSMQDVWLTFRSGDIIRFKQPQLFKSDSADRAWHYFTEADPHDKEVANIADLEGWTYYDHPDPVRVINAWLLHNRKTNKYYFRSWGRK